MKTYSFLVITLYFCFTIASSKKVEEDAPIVETEQGLIEGFSQLDTFIYLGIPYAKPPVGDLRWEEPVENDPWSPYVLNATFYKPACPQPNFTNCDAFNCPVAYDEDCLYLNVFVPQTIKTGEKKAVLLYIHGGSFILGGNSAQLYNSTYLSSLGDVIVVTINYRLGALGFLATGTGDQLQGNFGILDQKLAIKWVHDNIEAFGGDSSRITLFGQSAGAESVSIHLLSADIQRYFTNAIVQSSPTSIPFKNSDEMKFLREFFAIKLDCWSIDIECLKSKTVDEIIAAQIFAQSQVTSLKFLEYFEQWLPFIDGKVIKGQLLEIEKWQEGEEFELKPFIIGTLPEEAVFFIYSAFENPLPILAYRGLSILSFKAHAFKALRHFPPDYSVFDQRDHLADVVTKWVFTCSSRNFLESYMSFAPKNPYYLYVFDFPVDWDNWGNFTFCVNRTCHSADLPYTFDRPDEKFTLDGHIIAQRHIFYWSNFAKYQSPNGNETELEEIKSDYLYWKKYDTENRYNIRFKAQKLIIEGNYTKSDCDFFDSIGYYY